MESFREMAKDHVKDDPALQKTLVEHCIDQYDYEEAYHWCKEFKLNPNFVGFDIREKIAEQKEFQAPTLGEIFAIFTTLNL